MQLHQAVCATFEPPLQLPGGGCCTWQLLRPRVNAPVYTADIALKIVQREGFILAAMNADGSPMLCPVDGANGAAQRRLPLCLAPSVALGAAAVLAKPVRKGSVALAPFSFDAADDGRLPPFVWHVERFTGGGVAFAVLLREVRSWFAARCCSGESSDAAAAVRALEISDAAPHYLTDDFRLYSAEHTEGEPVGFEMKLAFPPVVDVTPFLEQRAPQAAVDVDPQLRRRLLADVSRSLIDAAIDCGFFFAVVQNDENGANGFAVAASESGAPPAFVSGRSAHCASARLLDVVRRSFGGCISMAAAGAEGDDAATAPGTSPLLEIVPERLDAKLTKVTLKSTTGIVKTGWNPPTFSAIELPQWLRHVHRCVGSAGHAAFAAQHASVSRCNAVTAAAAAAAAEAARTQVNVQEESTLSDLETYFRFGEQLAARMVAALLLGVDPRMTQWPSDELTQRHRELRGVEATTITRGDDDGAAPARVDAAQLYSLFRAVCYPPSRTGFAGEKQDDDAKDEDEEARSAVEGDDDDDRSSHRSSDTDDSEHKALYEHTDKTWITLLCAAPSLAGLQVVDANGSSFTNVVMPAHLSSAAGTSRTVLICNVGDALQMASEGSYVSRTHRARNPATGHEADATHCHCNCEACRVSLPLFVEPTPQRWPVSYEARDAVMSVMSL